MTSNGPNHSPPFGQTATLAEVVVVMHRAHGLDVSGYEETFLATLLEKRRQATAGETPAAYLDRLAGDGAEAEAFFRSPRVTYSEFFRNPIAFALIEQSILPGLLIEHEKSGRGEIRVWSAGCAAGQEAWSVAILLDELTGAKDTPPSHRIFATDVSEADLAVARTGKPVILVVEDDPDNLRTARALLEERYQVIEAEDGRAGIEQARQHQPDFILMDLAMPVMDGFAALAAIREDDTLRHIPVIAVTASAMNGSREEILARGFDGYVSKPIGEILFHHTVLEALHGHE